MSLEGWLKSACDTAENSRDREYDEERCRGLRLFGFLVMRILQF